MFKNITIREKLTWGIGIRSLILIIIGTIIVLSLSKIKDDWAEYVNLIHVKQQHLRNIRSLMGYAGEIHTFKNYVLRGQQKYFNNYQKKADEILTSISDYRSAVSLTPTEETSLKKTEELVEAYRNAVKRTQQLSNEGKTVMEIDSVVKINDKPYLEALSAMSGELDRLTTLRAEALSKLIMKVMVFLMVTIPISIIIFVKFDFFFNGEMTFDNGLQEHTPTVSKSE